MRQVVFTVLELIKLCAALGNHQMTELVLNGVSDAVITELGKRAASHHRSPSDEAKSSFTEALFKPRTNGWSAVDAIYERLSGSGRQFGDSAELIREDRDR